MSDQLQEISQLKQAVQNARAEQLRRDAQADQAEGIEKDSLAKLKELGCDSPEDALLKAKELRGKIESTSLAIQEKIEEAVRD